MYLTVFFNFKKGLDLEFAYVLFVFTDRCSGCNVQAAQMSSY